MHTFNVLMWKHLVVRKRRFLATAVELVLPCLFFVLLYVIWVLHLAPTDKDHERLIMEDNIHQTDILPLDQTPKPGLVIYSPKSVWTDTLMEGVGKKLQLNKLSSLQGNPRGYYGLSQNESLEHVYSLIQRSRDSASLVIFQGMQGETWPKQLSYTIRMKKDFMVHLVEALDENQGPHMNFGTIYEPFLHLQWAIDSSYLQAVSGNNVDKAIYLQEFPYVSKRKNDMAGIMGTIAPLLCELSLMMTFIFLVSRLMEHRTSGVQELIKMVGVSNNLLALSELVNVTPIGLLYATVGAILLTVGPTPIFPGSNGFLFWMSFFLHFFTVVSLAFVTSHMINTMQYATVLSVLFYILARFPNVILSQATDPHVGLVYLRLLTFGGPLYMFWVNVSALEVDYDGLTFSNMFETSDPRTFSPFACLIGMILQCCIFFLIAWYLSIVRPGKFGVAAHWNFCLKQSYWSQEVDVLIDDDSEEEPMTKDPRFFEDTPRGAAVGVKINNVSKVFENNRVLSHVSLDILKGEITVLLGHNGAGKTTLMSIITGMISPSEGQVSINGQQFNKNTRALRRNLGLCPQHNLVVPRLTVLENVKFFALLKGENWEEVEQTSLKLLDRLGLAEKAHNKSEELSGGMKRRLQLACALCGGSTVLMLDEPTSGLDLETRRELWDLLLSLRGERTVLLTTHFMEEADALGDRVAALHSGRLRCFATPMHLKKNMGSGFRLTLTTVGLPKEEKITSYVTKFVQGATLKEKGYNTISYNLPANQVKKFPGLFAKLEDKKPELGIDSIGVGVSTLEEVFLRLCSDTTTEFTSDNVDTNVAERTLERDSGLVLYLRQIWLLIKRQILFFVHAKSSFIVLQVILPIICLVLFTYPMPTQENTPSNNTLSALSLDMYKPQGNKRVVYDFKSSKDYDRILKSLSQQHGNVEFRATENIPDTVLTVAREDPVEYNKYLLGLELNDTSAKVLYTTAVRHAAPIALNILSNILAAEYLPWASGQTITTVNEPLMSVPLKSELQLTPTKDMPATVMWTVLVLFVYLGVLTNAVALPIKERLLGTRHIHMMSGCHPALFWVAALLAHTFVYTIAIVLPVIFVTFLDTTQTLDHPDFHLAIFVVLLLGTISYLTFEYFVSFFVGQRAANILLTVVIFVFGIVPAIVYLGANLFQTDLGSYKKLVTGLLYISPAATVSAGVITAGATAIENAKCDLNVDKCPLIASALGMVKCCENMKGSACYFCFEDSGVGAYLLIMFVQALFYLLLVILAQYGVFNSILDRLTRAHYTPPARAHYTDMVRAEAVYVDKAIDLPKKQIPDAMLVHDLHKRYFRPLKPFTPVHAVHGVSFSVKKGECFGLLGVNGAGKSTTFKMIAAETSATRGRIFANGHTLEWPRAQYLQTLGYCPQFFGLDEFLTGHENLQLILTMRGYKQADLASEIDAWIQVAGLEKYRKMAVAKYSGGCVRRTATVAALASGARVTLLDEPTSGVDVSARRRVHLALRRGLRNDRSVIITSHSMDEMEALCSRIAIMTGGEIAAIGPAAALKAAHAVGHAVQVKVRPRRAPYSAHASDELDAPNSLQSLKQALHEKFNCTLKDEHSTMLHYHINETMRYSELFTELESLKARYPDLIEDYSVNETTLEEVFLSFAQPKNDTGQV